MLALRSSDQGISRTLSPPPRSVELTHLASLYHDDVMDEADTRAGRRHRMRCTTSTAILIGDLLFGTASDIIADLGPGGQDSEPDVHPPLPGRSGTTGRARRDRPAYYLGVLADKTGVLIATAGATARCCPAAAADHRPGDRVWRAHRHRLPTADDLIDISSTGEVLGKTPAPTSREGKRTLPIIYALGRPIRPTPASSPCSGNPRSPTTNWPETLTPPARPPRHGPRPGRDPRDGRRRQDVLAPLPDGEGQDPVGPRPPGRPARPVTVSGH